jgi:soluble lytic murein transglycosylase-like protein
MKVCLAFLCVMFASCAMAGEFAVLRSGQQIRADRHELAGDVVRLFHQAGVTELPAAAIAGFQQDDYIPPVEQPVPTASAAKSGPAKPADTRTTLREAATRSGLPRGLVESVAKVESAFQQSAISPKGAIGVMQLMPETAKNLGADPHDVEQNIDAGTRLLRELLLKYNGDVVKALAAYNAGSNAVEKFGGLPPYQETREYVNKVIGAYKQAGGE